VPERSKWGFGVGGAGSWDGILDGMLDRKWIWEGSGFGRGEIAMEAG
jgi:hypothetical protein